MKKNIKSFTLEELSSLMVQNGESAYRGRQIFRWIYRERKNNFLEMTDISKRFRNYLSENYSIPTLQVIDEKKSNDGSVKYLIKLNDENLIESVFIPLPDRNTFCVSTQVGCKMKCAFCATGQRKFIRNLDEWEIVDQLLCTNTPKPVTNVVFMGMGEPFDNFDNVIKAIKIITTGLEIGKRHITVSTVGIIPYIEKFWDLDIAKLAISLHGTTEEQRKAVIPISGKYTLLDIIKTCENLKPKKRQRITFEYLLIKDFNDSDADALRLSKLLANTKSKINLLAYNENPPLDFKRPSEERITNFQNILRSKNYTVTYRQSRGRDVFGACGQLVGNPNL